MIWPLDPLQTLLERIYGVSSELRVDDFLISDPCSVRQLHRGGRESREKLLISETGDELDVALFVHQKILNTLAADDPVERLHDGNLDAFWIALEGVSHFLYLVCNACAGRSVRLLEIELQAEVDKFVATLFLLRRQAVTGSHRRLHHFLFERIEFDTGLSPEDLARYRDANRYAGKYCLGLSRSYLSRRRRVGLVEELRRFYRMPQSAKLRYIDHGTGR
ncbi:MAG: hypothetical protein C0629_07395 [Chromatiales bacterium]|nr:MAG: hypothetical protein C0629_07395 [Chromatiales bacterium]